MKTIAIDRAVVEQALEFIRAMNSHGWLLADYESDMERTVAGLEAALAQEQAEPVRCPASHVCDCQEVGQPCARAASKPVQEPVAVGTKALTHDAIADALSKGASLTGDQRAVLLGLVADDKVWQRECDRLHAELAALRTALAQEQAEPVQEPVAWMVYTLDGKSVCVTDNPADFGEGHRALPLYTAPPQRKPLTEKQIESAVCAEYVEKVVTRYDITIARAVERAHGIGGSNG